MRLAALSILLSACAMPAVETGGPPSPADGEEAPAAASPSASGWATELARLDADLAFYSARFHESGSWLDGERAAALAGQRARLTGSMDDYDLAEALLADAFALAPEGSGPLLTRAGLHLTLHRVDAAAADLAAMDAWPLMTAEARYGWEDAGADLALDRGDLDEAGGRWLTYEATRDSPWTAAGLARVNWLRGDFEAADLGYEVALERYHGVSPEPVAWIHLQRGILDLDQGDLAGALAHYADADAAMSGHWLVEEHIAEAVWGLGDPAAAEAIYRDVVARTGSPELMGALGKLLIEQGRTDEGQDWIAQATAGFEAWVDRYPEAASGHALSHFLAWDPTPDRALALAEANAAARPNGEALTLLSEARLASGDREAAHAAALDGLATGTRSAGLFWAAAASAPDAASAAWYRDAARAIDPTIGG